MRTQNEEIKNLRKFKNRVENGEIKDGAKNDFITILQKNRKHTDELKEVVYVLDGEDQKEVTEKEIPNSVDSVIYTIREEFHVNSKIL